VTTTTSRKKSKSKHKTPPAAPPKLAVHYTADYIVNPPHPVTVNVIGCGGTGSQVLNSLARMHSALRALGHPGLFVRAVDPDRVTSANMGRQLFSSVDIDQHKCVILISRINRFFGTDWEAVPDRYDEHTTVRPANITISCVDTGSSRKQIKKLLLNCRRKAADKEKMLGKAGRSVRFPVHSREWEELRRFVLEPYEFPYYWMDFGNTTDRGQVVVSTVGNIPQPKKSEFACVSALSAVDKYHPDILRDAKGEDQGPSCSLAEALGKQDLFINTNLANMGLAILWKMFRELRIRHHGCYINLQNLQVNPIPIR